MKCVFPPKTNFFIKDLLSTEKQKLVSFLHTVPSKVTVPRYREISIQEPDKDVWMNILYVIIGIQCNPSRDVLDRTMKRDSGVRGRCKGVPSWLGTSTVSFTHNPSPHRQRSLGHKQPLMLLPHLWLRQNTKCFVVLGSRLPSWSYYMRHAGIRWLVVCAALGILHRRRRSGFWENACCLL